MNNSKHVVASGTKFNMLTVIKEDDSVIKYRYFICLCDCGNTKSVKLSHLKDGHTKSCGCLNVTSNTKHGYSHHRLYHIWIGIISRCYNLNNHAYNRYGGRGIFVCDEWMNVANFIKDMEPSYIDGLQVDRINNDKEYSKYNCRWSSRIEQANNKSNNRIVTYENRSYTVANLSRKIGINKATLSYRVLRNLPIKCGQ